MAKAKQNPAAEPVEAVVQQAEAEAALPVEAEDQNEPADEPVEAVCLMSCVFGEAGEVVSLPEEDAKAGEKYGMLDLHPEAIAARR